MSSCPAADDGLRNPCPSAEGSTQSPGPAPQTPADPEVPVLIEVDDLLASGQLARAYQVAVSALSQPAAQQDRVLAAQLRLRLALGDLAQCRARRGLQGAQRALTQLRGAQALRAEVQAQLVCSRAASALGQHALAMEAALLGCRLSHDLPLGQERAEAQLTLAMAFGWGDAPSMAEQVFAGALAVVERLGIARWTLEVRTQRALSRMAHSSPALRSPGQADLQEELSAISAALRGPEAGLEGKALLAEGSAQRRASAMLACALMASQLGHAREAQQWWVALQTLLTWRRQPCWLHAGLHWLRSAMAERQGHLAEAALHAQRMARLAADVQCLRLARLGHGLAASLLERQGQTAAALGELKCQLDLDRARAAQDRQALPERMAQHLAARDKDQRVELLVEESRRFRQWAFEDPLTGLANLRRFNECLAQEQALQQEAGRPQCAALIDVDRFKAINDGYSHAVGDQVLQALARILQACVRETDVAARLGGDEFAILFRATEEATARRIVDRILHEVQHHPWHDIAAGLKVSISVGVVQARPGDGGRALVERGDAAMYHHKRTTQAGELG